MNFKIGDKVKILPSATIIGVLESEVGKIVKVIGGYGSDILVSDSRGNEHGCWCVNDYDIIPFVEIGQQLVFDFMQQS